MKAREVLMMPGAKQLAEASDLPEPKWHELREARQRGGDTAEGQWDVLRAMLENRKARPKFNLRRDGKHVLTGDEFEILAYLHRAHSCSADWALKHEGYTATRSTSGDAVSLERFAGVRQ